MAHPDLPAEQAYVDRAYDCLDRMHRMKTGALSRAAVRLGVDYESLRKINPTLIYCHTRGFEKSWRDSLPGNDQTGAALAGTASAVFNTFRQVGGAVAIAVFGALIASPPTFVPGLRVSFATAAALLLASALLSLRIRRCR